MNLIRHIKNISEFVIFLFLKFTLPKANVQKKSLLLINTGLIGDLIVSTILLENSEIFKNFEKVHFLIKNQYLDLFKDYSGKVSVIGYSYENYKYSFFAKYRTLVKLRREGYETCINLTAARGILNEEMTHLVGAKEIITLNSFMKYLGNNIGKYFDSKYSTILAKNILNEYDKHIELIHFLSTKNQNIIFNQNIVFPRKIISPKLQSLENSIIIAPFTSVMNRDWKKDNFSELINNLKTKNRIVLLGSKNQLDQLKVLSGNDKNITILAGELNLNELPILIKEAKLFIGLDSGLTHIALKMDCPLVAIIGGGEFGRFFPYKESRRVKYLYSNMDCFLCHWECTKKEKYCVSDVSLDTVLKEANNMLV